MEYTFKYNTGYIIINAENLYLTSSGSLKETAKLPEKNVLSQKANKRRIMINTVILVVLFLVSAAAVVYAVTKGTLQFWPLIFIYFGIYKLMHFLMRQTGSRYKIPLSKIEAVEPVDKGLKISFRNGDGNPDFELLKGVEEKDAEVLAGIAAVN